MRLRRCDSLRYSLDLFKNAQGRIPLVVKVNGADAMASLLRLKREVEHAQRSTVRMVFIEAAEAHLLAKEIAEADIGIIQISSRPFPRTWERRRM